MAPASCPSSGSTRSRACHPAGAATGSAFAAWIRGHWKIENQLHHVRDRTFREDASKIRPRHLPRVMAGLRHLAIGVHRQDGHTNIAAALRHTGAAISDPSPPSDRPDEPRHKITFQSPCSYAVQSRSCLDRVPWRNGRRRVVHPP
ncbi:transposase [Streptomyces sp. NPDC016640]|uniref:transposase n=1 Tax=Streptomyces sp. NPDC016640 TaxID=3364969 RepID=UPI0036FF5BC9